MLKNIQHKETKNILLVNNDPTNNELCKKLSVLAGYIFDIYLTKEFSLNFHSHKKYDGFLVMETRPAVVTRVINVLNNIARATTVLPLICVFKGHVSMQLMAHKGVDGIIPFDVFSAELFDTTFRFIEAHKVSQRQQNRKLAKLKQTLEEYNSQRIELIESLQQRDEEIRQISDHLEQLERMNSLGRMTSSVVHDFNNVLTSLNGGLDMLKRRLEQKQVFSESVQQTYSLIVNTIPLGERMLKSLLNYVSTRSSVKDSVDLNLMVSEMAAALTMIFGRSVQLKYTLANPLPQIVVERSALERAILNLAINAKDAMQGRRKAECIISTQLQTVKRQTFVFFKMADTGTGMSAEVIKKACLPFYSTKALGKGTGLGLAQVHDFVEGNGGILLLQNRCGGGLEVSMGFPVSKMPPS